MEIENYWVKCGSLALAANPTYIMTETVKSNLAEIARAVSGSNTPILLQGETSIGKTSLITYLARATGNECVRINNHEHTDLQVQRIVLDLKRVFLWRVRGGKEGSACIFYSIRVLPVRLAPVSTQGLCLVHSFLPMEQFCLS